MVRLPSSGRRLIRGSITDITERKRSELLAIGERRVFERMTSNADLAATLEAISETAERVTPDALCTVSTYGRGRLGHPASPSPVSGCRASSSRRSARFGIAARNRILRSAAIFLQRQVVVADDRARRSLGESAQARARAGLRACWSIARPRHRRPDGRPPWRSNFRQPAKPP
jgi:hypothetical protein